MPAGQPVLGAGGVRRPDPEVVGPVGHQRRRRDGLARRAAEDVPRPGHPAGRGEQQVERTEVRAAGAHREGDVDPVVDEAQRARLGAQADPGGEVVQLAVGAALGRTCTTGAPADSAAATTASGARPSRASVSACSRPITGGGAPRRAGPPRP